MKSLKDILLPVINDVQAGQKTSEVTELWGASKALFLFGLAREAGRPLVVVTSSPDAAETLAEDLRFFAQKLPRAEAGANPPRSPFVKGGESEGTAAPARFDVHVFPAWDLLPFEADSPDSRTMGSRMCVLYSLISGTAGIYLVPIQSLLQKLPPWELFADAVRTITKATPVDPDRFTAALVSMGYESASLVTRVGEFSRRGGIIDFFSPLHEQPVRMELFGDAIESLRLFDPETQRITKTYKEGAPGRDDLVDLAAAYTLANGGEVFVVPPEQLPSTAPVAAAILRY